MNYNITQEFDLSEQYLISCDPMSLGCNGGSLQGALDFAIAKGIPSE